MRIGVVGCGLIANKRCRDLPEGHRVVACADVVQDRAEALAASTGAEAFTDWRAVVERGDVDAVFVSTTHDALPVVTLAAVETGKHVLVEKPAARRPGELDPVIAACERTGARVRIGFNHRLHPALQKARSLVDEGRVGDLMFIRARYGHGGRVGYDREWRADPNLSGGGELIDQGVHLVDLARWFLGEFRTVEGCAPTFFWDMPVDDNAFLLLRTEAGQTAFLHASCTEWKNTFSFEIYGSRAKIDVFGLGGSYGTERITLYEMRPEMGPPDTTSWEFPRQDRSWVREFDEFVRDVEEGRDPSPGLRDARAVLEVVETIYEGDVARREAA